MQYPNDPSSSDDGGHGGAAVAASTTSSAGVGSTTGKRRIIKRGKSALDSGAAAASHAGPNTTELQVVSSEQEADALVRRLRQLEAENTSLASTLAKVCDENASLSGVVSQLGEKVTELSLAPLKATSVLHSLFEPEKTGWFGGSKSAARDQLEKLADALQAEFMEYKASHASSNDEMQAVMAAMQSANTNAADVARIANEQQQAIAKGPAAMTIRIVPVLDGDSGDGGVTVDELREEIRRQQARCSDLQAQLKHTNVDLRGKSAEVIKLQSDLKEYREQARAATAAASGGTTAAATAGAVSSTAALKLEVELQKAKDENAKLRDELLQLRNALAAEERLHMMKKTESEELAQQLAAQRGTNREEVAELKKRLAESQENSLAGCPRCAETRAELEAAKEEAAAAQKELQQVKAQLAQSVAKSDTSSAELQARLIEAESKLAAQETVAKHSVPQQQYSALEMERDTLAHELALAKDRVSSLEETSAAKSRSAPSAGEGSLSESVVLDTLEKNKDRVSRLEFERDQLKEQLRKAQAYALTRDQEASRLERSAADDKQRVAFLIKKCANVTADLRAATTARDALSEDLDKHKIDMRQLQRQVDSLSSVQKKYDDVVKEKARLEARLAAVEELEEKLVRAKETIAYMELAQSRTINMSQYAELQAAKDKLENTMGPLKKKLEEANKEIERLKSVTDAQHMVTGSQLNSVQNMQDQLASATANEGKLRDKVAALQSENDRLTKVNESLEANMRDMQDGIKEMALQMEKERTTATTKAEANSQKQVELLKAELAKAQAELATVQATKGQFVAEGLYQNACTERDRLADENRRKGFDFEKQKSEILIYRQTIADLEAENDEHVKEIEALQDRYQTERASLSERLSAEQRRVAELSSTVTSLKEELKVKEEKLDQSASAAKDLQEVINKQKRAYEEKCEQEERLNTQLAALQSNNVILQSTYEQKLAEARAASPAPPSVPAAAAAAAAAAAPIASSLGTSATVANGTPTSSAEELAVTNNKLYKAQCDNDRLYGELKRMQLKHKTESDDDQRMIQLLQVQVKNRMSADMRAAYEAEISKSAALRSSNEALLKENEQLKKQVSTIAPSLPTSSFSLLSAGAPPSAIMPTNAADLQAQLNQLQQQMALQKSGFDAAMTQAIADAEAKQQRITELEADLANLQERDHDASEARTGNNSMGGAHPLAGVDDEAGAEDDGAAATTRPKKKVKKVKKKKSLAEQVAAMDPAADILAPSTAAAPLPGGAVASTGDDDPVRKLNLQLQLAQADLLKSQKELELLRSENASLKDSVAQLTRDSENAREDLDQAHAAMDEERLDFETRIHGLENQLKALSNAQSPPLGARTASLSMSGMDSPGNRSFSRQASMQETEMQLRSARDENEKLKLENRQLKNDLAKAASSSTSNGGGGGATSHEVKQMRKALKQKDAEVQSLANQLVPTKNKLVEYMAMADRLGLQYPFPPQLEGPTVMRLRAMNIQAANRATSAPLPEGGGAGGRGRASGQGATANAVHDASPAPKPPPGARQFRGTTMRPPQAASPQLYGGGSNDFDDLR